MKIKIYYSITFVAMILFLGCSAKVIPFKGNYPDKPYEITSQKPFEEIWSNIIDLFAKNGLSIKVIDKQSGLIVSEKTSLTNHYSFENADGYLEKADAWVVLSKINYMGSNMPPTEITGEWNVRIKSDPRGETIINVNLTNIYATRHVPASTYSGAQNLIFQGKSTGHFEKFITDLVK